MLRGILSAGICLLFLLSGCTSDEGRRIEEVLDFAGDNSGELKQVLSHYEGQGGAGLLVGEWHAVVCGTFEMVNVWDGGTGLGELVWH